MGFKDMEMFLRYRLCLEEKKISHCRKGVDDAE